MKSREREAREQTRQHPVTNSKPAWQAPKDSPMKKRAELMNDDLFEADLSHEAPAEEEASHGGSDDALGLYLKQMGAIPLLNREKELALARQLELVRSRYRRSVLFCWWAMQRVVGLFERIE